VRALLADPAAFTPAYDHALAAALAAAGAGIELATAPFRLAAPPATPGYAHRLVFARPMASPGLGRLAGRDGPRRALRAALYPFDLARLLAAARRRPPDVVHLQWSLAPALERAWLAALARRGVARVVTVHNPEPRRGDRGATARSARLAAGAERVIVLSRWAGGQLAAGGVPATRIAVVPHGVGPPPEVDRATARARLALPATAPIALCAGLLRPYKGLDVALAAFREVAATLPEATLVIAGRAAGAGGELAARVRALGLAERVRLELRYLAEAELDLHFAACDVVVLPYLEASQSGIGFSAIANERAVVASRVGGLGEMVGEEESGLLVAPGEPVALARALAGLLADRERADAAGRRLRRRALAAGAGWPDVAAATLAVYQSAIDARHAGAG
jgi:glycosyltransferase involved in cell wall biosynthesis